MSTEEVQPSEPVSMRYLFVFTIGLGFFTTGITWALYDSYIPVFLRTFITGDLQKTIIGFIMVIDNIAAITLQPYIGAKSDHTWTKWGRRMPYILVGAPVASLFFALIPFTWLSMSFWLMITCITLFNIFMAIYRAPVVALMPDLVPSVHRSKANGIINLMGGVGAIYAFLVGSYLYEIQDPNLAALFGVPVEHVGAVIAFLSTSIIMVIAIILLYAAIKEPEKPYAESEEKVGVIQAFKEVIGNKDRSALAILMAIMFWFLAYQTLSTWFTTYGIEILHVTESQASRALTPFALAFVLFALPAGFMAGSIGRKNTILIGLIGIIIMMGTVWFTFDYIILLIELGIAGIFWAMINVNSIVIVWELATGKKLGAYTGLYYFFSSISAIFGPIIAGMVFDVFTIGVMFPWAIFLFVIALLFTLVVKSGEVGDEKLIEEAVGEVEF